VRSVGWHLSGRITAGGAIGGAIAGATVGLAALLGGVVGSARRRGRELSWSSVVRRAGERAHATELAPHAPGGDSRLRSGAPTRACGSLKMTRPMLGILRSNLSLRDWLVALGLALIVGAVAALVGKSAVWLLLGAGVFALLCAGFVGRQRPTRRLIGRSVVVPWGLGEAHGTVERLVGTGWRPQALVQIGSETEPIAFPMTALTFPTWKSRLFGLIPRQFYDEHPRTWLRHGAS